MTTSLHSGKAQASLAGAVRATRKGRGMTLAALAGRLDTTRHRLFEFEHGGGSMPLLSALSDALDIEWVGLPPGATIGARIAAWRQRKGWTLGALAARTGLPRATILSIEADRAHTRSLQRLIDALGLTVRPRAKNEPQPAHKRDIRLTPPALVETVRTILGGIDLDPCGHENSFVGATRSIHFPDHDGLVERWEAERVFVNPPFSKTEAFLQKAMAEHAAGRAQNIVFLMRVRTTTISFQKLVAEGHLIIFLRKKIAFVNATGERLLGPMAIPLQLVIMSADEGVRERAKAAFSDCVAIN